MVNMFWCFCILIAVAIGALGQPPVPTEHDSCQAWDTIAKDLTHNTGAQQECWSNGTEPCTRIDCKGAYEYNAENAGFPTFIHDIEVDYCFGVILNHCDNPINLDFYIQVPAKNVNRSTRIYHNTLLSIPGLNYSLGNAKAQGFLYFEMERANNSVTFSVTVRVKVDIGVVATWPSPLQKRLISSETVQVPPCAPGGKDVSDIPKLGQCFPPHWKNPGADAPNVTYKGALNQKCSETNHCREDAFLMCDIDQDLCVCAKEFEAIKNGSECIPKSRYNMMCDSDDDCAMIMSEKCSLQSRKCVCEDRYFYNPNVLMCVEAANPSTGSPAKPQTPSASAHQDQGQSNDDTHDKRGSQNMTAVIAGSVIGGLLVLGGILLVAYFAIRRLRCPYRNREMLLEDDSDGVM